MSLQLYQRHYSALLPLGTALPLERETELVLPFVGRTPEMTRIVSFAHAMTSSTQLSLLWIEGERGIGKTRLLTEALKSVSSRIAIPRIRLLPDTSSLAHELAAALTDLRPADVRQDPIPEQLPPLLASLRELVHLQPTLLVLENLHLLDPKGIAELMGILHGMENERIAVICTALPHSDTALGSVLPFLSGSLELEPISLKELREMGYAWNYDLSRLPRLTRFLHKNTRGIPLVIELTLKNLLSHRPELARNPVAVVRRVLRETKRTFTLNLTQGLTEAEIDAARRLATLGETFSMAGARILLESADELTDKLCRAGVLIRLFDELPPMFGQPSEEPNYVFAHPILHEHILSGASPADDRLFDVIESETPLYSTTLFVYIAGNTPPGFDTLRIDRTIEGLIELTTDLINSPYWEEASVIREAARKLYRLHKKAFTKERRHEIQFHLLRLQLHILNAFPSHPDFIAAADKLLQITGNPADEGSALQHLIALEYSLFRTDKRWTFRADSVFDETEKLVRQFPGLLLHPIYINVIGQIAGALRAGTSYEALEQVRVRFEAIMEKAEATGDNDARRTALLEIAPSFISIFRTPEDLEDRKRLADTIAHECGTELPEGRFAIAWPRFLESVGEMQRAKEVLQRWTHYPISGYDLSREFILRLMELVVDAALDEDLSNIEERAKMALQEFHRIQEPESNGGEITLAQTAVATHIIQISLMRGELEWGNRVALEICDNNDMIAGYMQCEQAILKGDLSRLNHLADEGQLSATLVPLISYVLNREESSRQEAIQTARTVLNNPVIQRHNILSVRLVLKLLGENRMDPERSLLHELRDEIQGGAERSLEWLTLHQLPAYARPLLREAEPLLRSESYDLLTYAPIEPEGMEEREDVQDTDTHPLLEPTIHLSAIGTISYTLPGEKPVKVRGARPQQLLGLLIANATLTAPLSLADFRFHVTGSSSPEEGANYLRVLVSRVRKQLGPDAILSDGESAPHLNLELVQVDVIEAIHLVEQALSFARNRLGGQAFDTLITAFEILGKGELYPALSGEIFIAAKEEFVNLLRTALLTTASLLRGVKDFDRAITLLTAGLRLLPEDIEIEEMMNAM